MDDFYAVALFEGGLWPVGATDDVAIQLNREALGRERQMLNEVRKVYGIWQVARFAVDLDKQLDCFLSNFRLDE